MPGMKLVVRTAAAAVAAALVVALCNYLTLYRPVTDRLVLDPRNSGISVLVHYQYGLSPSTIVIDLRDIKGDKAPLDLWRVLMSSAGELSKRGRSPERALLQRSGKTVFVMKGDEFIELGRLFDAGENPVFLLRTLPEKLRNGDGSAAYGTWTGGVLGVLAKQVEDLGKAGLRWFSGSIEQPEQ